MSRRPALLSAAVAAFAALPIAPKAARADEAAELEALRKKAMQINSLIETTKQAALPDAPNYQKDVKALKAGDKVAVPEEPKAAQPQPKTAGPKPDPKLSPKDVVKVLLEAMVNNDSPSEDAGLRTVLSFSSSSNPYASQVSKARWHAGGVQKK